MKWTSHSHIFLHKWNIRDFFKRLCSLIRIVFSFYACQPSALLFKVLSPLSIFCLFTYFGVFLSEWWFFQYISGSEVWGCFVGPTWKCLFYSTSCFQRPFVNFSCSVCVCVSVFWLPSVVGSHGACRRTFFNFWIIISCSSQSFPSLLPVQLMC